LGARWCVDGRKDTKKSPRCVVPGGKKMGKPAGAVVPPPEVKVPQGS